MLVLQRHVCTMLRGKKSYNLESDSIREPANTPNLSSDANLNKSSTGKPEERKNRFKSFEGLLYTALGSSLFSLTYVFAKKVTYISTGEQSLIYNVGNLVFNLPVFFYYSREVFITSRQDSYILIIRAVMVALSLYTRLIAYRYLPLAEAAILMSTLPALTSAGAYIFLKEPCSYAQVVAVFITMVGMLTSMRIPELLKDRSNVRFDSEYFLGFGIGVISVLITVFVYVSLRKMRNVHFSVIIMYSACTGAVINAIITGAFESFSLPHCGRDTLEMALIGVLGYVANMCMIIAFQRDIATVIAVVQCATDIIIGMIFQTIFFNQIPDIYVGAGAVLVMLSILVISVRSWLVSLPKTSSIRKKLKYLWI